jgi:plasmid stabilization system protein ParE
MSLPVRLRPLAQAEFDDAADDYERKSFGLGPRFTRAVDKVLERIGRFPEMYAFAFRDVRCAPVRRFPFVVLYRVTDDEVIVLGFLPAMSDPAAWRQRG